MNNTLHTWQISFGNIVDQNKKTICFLPERKNNDTAHLIASAPDLLLALEALLSDRSRPSFLTLDEWHNTHLDFRSTLRKAKGEA
jgi:hypothetical protein